jgi:[ribosomal protein S18]-alanine N-acetyltransferase
MFSLFSAAPPSVRVLRTADASDVASLHGMAFLHGWSTAELESMLREPHVCGHGIGTGRRLDGFVVSRRVADEAEILSVAVSPKCQGRGYGRRLLEAHLGALAAHGARTVFLEVEEGNTPALALYQRFGFRQVGSRPGYYRRKDGRTANALVLKLALA